MTFFLHSTSARLSCLRQELGLSAESLSSLVGVSIETITQWEQGLEAIPESVWEFLARLPRELEQPRRANG